MPFLSFILGFLFSYLLGSVPFGFLIARVRGVDIRTLGSGNIGATNVFRSLGKGPGLLTFSLDFGKGLVATRLLDQGALWLAGALADGSALPGSGLWLRLVCGTGVVLGHSFPVFLGFKGGKGVATGAGLTVGLAPQAALGAAGVWIVAFLTLRYVSLASILAALAVMALSWSFDPGKPRHLLPAVLSTLAALVILRHRANIGRLLQGTENRFVFQKGRKQ